MKCTFTTNITDELDCDPSGDFDRNGFPVKRCNLYPCQQYKEMVAAIEFRAAAQNIMEPKTQPTTGDNSTPSEICPSCEQKAMEITKVIYTHKCTNCGFRV